MTLYSVKAAEAAHAGVVSVSMETGLDAAVQPSPVFYASGRYWVGIAGDLFALDAPGGAVTPYSMDTARYNFSMSYDGDSGRLLAASKTSSSASAAGFSMSVFEPTAGALVFSYLNKAEDTKYTASILAPRGTPLVMIVNTAAATKTVTIRRYRGYESRHIPLLTFDEVSAYIKAWQPDTFAGI